MNKYNKNYYNSNNYLLIKDIINIKSFIKGSSTLSLHFKINSQKSLNFYIYKYFEYLNSFDIYIYFL